MAERVGGLHAQVLSAAELQVWARSEVAARGDLDRALWRDRSLVRTWSMRGTLHLLTPEQHASYVAAISPYRYRPAWLALTGLGEREADELVKRQEGLLADGVPHTRRELAAASGREIDSWGGLLGPAARRGLLVHGPPRGQEVTFVSAAAWLGPRPAPAARAARAAWLRRYLRAYGPAGRADFARWWGARTLGSVDECFDALAGELQEVRVGGRALWLLAADLEELREGGGGEAAGGVCLLPGFDVFVLGHAVRDHLVDAKWRRLVYRAAGWVSATVLREGCVAGTWRHRLGSRLRIEVSAFRRFRRPELRALEAEAERLAAFLGRPLTLSYT